MRTLDTHPDANTPPLLDWYWQPVENTGRTGTVPGHERVWVVPKFSTSPAAGKRRRRPAATTRPLMRSRARRSRPRRTGGRSTTRSRDDGSDGGEPGEGESPAHGEGRAA